MSPADQVVPNPLEPPRPEKRWLGRRMAISLSLAVAVSTVAIWSVAKLRGTTLPPSPRRSSFWVSGTTISLSEDAPEWRSLALGRAEPARQYWTDPVPARITADEGRSSGAATNPSCGVATVTHPSSLWALAEFFDSDGYSVTSGTRAQFGIGPSVMGEGSVEVLALAGGTKAHGVVVRMRVQNRDGQLEPDTYGWMKLLNMPVPASMQVPATAVVSRRGREYVYVRTAPGSFARRDVITGPTHGETTLVLSGVRPGETLIQRGALLLDNQIFLSQWEQTFLPP